MTTRPDHEWETFRAVLGEAPAPEATRQRIIEGVLPDDEHQRKARRARRRAPRSRRFRLSVTGWATVGGVAMLLAGLGLWFGGVLSPSPSTARHLSASGRGPRGAKLAGGGVEWRAPLDEPFVGEIGPHLVKLAKGAELRQVGGSSRSPRLVLRKGAADFTVQPLVGGRTFTVDTRDVRVTVVGTRFSLSLDKSCTAVRVSQGAVRVEARVGGHVRILRRGERHAVCRPPARASLDAESHRVLRAITWVGKRRKLGEAERALEGYLSRKPKGRYAEEALFFLVFAKERLGKAAEAKALARAFLQRFAKTPRADLLRRWLARR